MMAPDSLIESIIRLLNAQQIPVQPDDELLTGGYVDSIAMMRLISEIEEELGMKIPADELVPENFLTVRVMARFLADLRLSA